MDPLSLALGLAARKHMGQLRKDKATPYVVHPIRVMLTVLREFGRSDPDTLAAAVLHDTIEDTATDFDDIAGLVGPKVAEYVAYLTKDKRLPEEERESVYFRRLEGAPLEVKFCKVADTVDNLRDSANGGNREKTLAKAQRLLGIFGSDERLAPALAVLRKEMGL